VLAAGARACAASAADPVVALAFAAIALCLAAEEACQAALGAPAAAALLCCLLQARAPPPSALAWDLLAARRPPPTRSLGCTHLNRDGADPCPCTTQRRVLLGAEYRPARLYTAARSVLLPCLSKQRCSKSSQGCHPA